MSTHLPRPLSCLRAFVAFLFLAVGLAHAATPTHIVISQIFGAGGNSGSTITYDYVELVNPTSGPLSLSGYSLQYASTAGTSYQVAPLPAITLQAGEYYLVGAVAAGTVTNPGSTVVSDAELNTSTTGGHTYIAMAGGAGKIALSSTTTALTVGSGCPTSAAIVDFVAYGSGTTCAVGTGPTGTLSSTLAAIRTNPCNASVSNSTDFNTATPAPHNSNSTLLSCGNSASPLAATGAANPTTLYLGAASLLTVQVNPGTQPASSGITVSANLTAIGGSATQQFYDDGTNGDVTAGDNVFSFSATSTATGTFSLSASVSDTQLRTATASIALTVKTPPPTVGIRTIQAQKPSAYATQEVTTSGIVIGIKSNGFYLEAKDADSTPTTPEGILVYTGSTALPSYIVLGAEVQVQGVVNTYPAYPSATLTPGTEIDGPQTFSLLSSGNTLPTPIKITAAMDSPTGGIQQFAKYEGMRVAIDSVTTTSGTGATLDEPNETNTSNGRFYGVVTGVARPFREPGIAVTDTTYTTAIPPSVPLWDSNPELIYFDSLVFGAPAMDVTSNATVTNVVGVMDFSFGAPEFIIDKANRPTVTGLMTAQPVPAQSATEFTVASFNMERFYNDVSVSNGDQDNPGGSQTVVTTSAYQRRLAKASLAIRNVLNFPDIIGAQELENLAVLTDLANKISTDAVAANQADPVYKPYLFLATDGTDINTGVLVKSTRVTTLNAEQFGLTTTFTNSVNAQATLNDRTPLVMHLGIKRLGLADYPITFIDVHQRSLSGADDPSTTGQTVRIKREKQAEFLASLIQGYQAAGEHVITVGDYNSFEFSDGFADVLGVVRGNPVPSTQVVITPAAGLATPNLVDLVTLLPAEQRQSYVEVGSAQVLDHIVVTQDLVPLENGLVYAHMDSDMPLVYLNDATRPERVSDHDPAVAYFSIPGVAPAINLSASTLTFTSQTIGTTSTAQTITVTNSGASPLNITSITATGAFAQTNTCANPVAVSATCTISVTFTPTTVGAATGSVSIASNAPTSSIALTGTGTGTPVVSLSASSLTFTTQQLATTSTAQTVTLTNTGTAPLTIASITASGAFSQSNTCTNSVSIAVNATCTISVTFAPTAVGTANGTILINSNTTPSTIALTGTGAGTPAITLSAAALTFPGQLVGTTSTAQTVTITNSGTDVLNVSSILATGAFTQTNTCTSAIAVNATCTVSVTFKPTAVGTANGAVIIASNAAASSFALTGTGTGAPAITLSAPSLTFGTQLASTTSTAQTLTVTNSGSLPLTISAITTTGAFAQTSTCASAIAVNATCTISVTFRPTAAGAATGSVIITSNAASSPNTVTTAGTGSDFSFSSTTPTTTVVDGSSATVSFTLTSAGGYTGSVTFACSGLTTGEACTSTPVTLAATGTTTASVVISTTQQVTPNAHASAGSQQSANTNNNSTMRLAGISFASLTLLTLAGSIKRKRLGKYTRLLSLVALLATLGALAGCNDAGVTYNTNGTPSGTQTITVTATSGGASHSTTVTLTVK